MEPDFSELIRKWIKLTLSRTFHSIFIFSKDHDVSMPQIGALIRIHRKGNPNVSDIGADMGTSSAAASQLLNRMVQLGWIERSEDPDDRRIKQINLTQNGLEFVNDCFHASYKWFEDLVDSLKDDEKQEVMTVLNRLINKIEISNGKSD